MNLDTSLAFVTTFFYSWIWAAYGQKNGQTCKDHTGGQYEIQWSKEIFEHLLILASSVTGEV